MTKFTGRFANDMEWRFAQPEPKAGKQVFYGRLCSWYTKEQSILTWEKWLEVMRAKWFYGKEKKYVPKYSRLQEDEWVAEYTWIDITYSKDEARVFRKEFANVIENLERELRQTEDKKCIKELNDKIELAKAELDLFNKYNK